MLAAIALCVGTGIFVKSGQLKYAWVTGLPLTWLIIITSTAAWQKVLSDDVRVGFFAAANDLSTKSAAGLLPPEKALVAPQLIFNQRLDAYLTIFFVLMLWLVVCDMLRMCSRYLAGSTVLALSETPYEQTKLMNS